MNSDSALGYLVTALAFLFVYIVLIRQIFGISRFQNRQDAIVKLLSEIALKNGVEPDKVNAIIESTKWKNR